MGFETANGPFNGAASGCSCTASFKSSAMNVGPAPSQAGHGSADLGPPSGALVASPRAVLPTRGVAVCTRGVDLCVVDSVSLSGERCGAGRSKPRAKARELAVEPVHEVLHSSLHAPRCFGRMKPSLVDGRRSRPAGPRALVWLRSRSDGGSLGSPSALSLVRVLISDGERAARRDNGSGVPGKPVGSASQPSRGSGDCASSSRCRASSCPCVCKSAA